MTPRNLAFAALFVLLVSVARLPADPSTTPRGDEATELMAAMSLWEEGDLLFDHRDLLRSYTVWNGGPRGLVLASDDGGQSMRYPAPVVFPLLITTVYGILGPRGPALASAVLLMALVAALWRRMGRGGWALAVSAAALGLSASLAWVLRGGPVALQMAAVWAGLAVTLQAAAPARRWGASGVALAVGAATAPLLGVFAVLPAALLVRRRQLRRLAVWGVAFLLTLSVAALLQRRLAGHWLPWRGAEVLRFHDQLPVETPRAFFAGRGGGEAVAGWRVDLEPRRLLREVEYLALGRRSGLLPHFPFALLALAVGVGAWRRRWPWWGVLGAYLALVVAVRPPPGGGEGGLPSGAALAAVLPVFLLLAPRLPRARLGLLAATVAAGVWTMPAILAAQQPGMAQSALLQRAAFRLLPAELTRLPETVDTLYWVHHAEGAYWLLPRAAFFGDEGNPRGVWMRGASKAEVWVASATPLEEIRFTARSLAADDVLVAASGGETVSVRFDSVGKRQGAEVRLPARPTARDLDVLEGAGGEYYYRLELASSQGVVPARRNPRSRDERYLGTFLVLPRG